MNVFAGPSPGCAHFPVVVVGTDGTNCLPVARVDVYRGSDVHFESLLSTYL